MSDRLLPPQAGVFLFPVLRLDMLKMITLLIALFSFVLIPQQAHAKSYTIDNAQIDVQINPDGTADVSETRTYSFDGHFENGEWRTNIEKNRIDINSVSLSEDGKEYQLNSALSPGYYSVDEFGNDLVIKWKYSADDETKNFTIKFKIMDAVSNYSDTAQFYWKFIGDGWGVSTQKVRAIIKLPYPATKEHLKAWGHGPLDGVVSITDLSTITFEVNILPANTFFEGRVVFPTLSGIPIDSDTKLQEIITEEAAYINETIEQEERMKFKPFNFIFFLSLIGALYTWKAQSWFKKWLEKGKDPKLPEINPAGSLHEPPSDLDPAMVDALLAFSYLPSTNSVTATILNLCRKKIIKITQQKKAPVLGLFSLEPEITFEIKDNPSLTEIESKVVSLLYLDEQTSITKTEILEKLKDDTTRLTDWNAWRDKVKSQLLKNGYLDTESNKLKSQMIIDIVFSGIFSFIVIFFAQFLGIFSSRPELIILGVMGISGIYVFLLILFYITMDKRTLKGAQEAAGWIAFKKYLKDYSVTKNYPLESVIIWEKYIVYGSALGISLKALSELPIKFKGATTQTSYLYAAGLSDSGQLNFGSLSTGFNSLSSSYGASGSGSSGGFSGGGGGGGGGSGGGMS